MVGDGRTWGSGVWTGSGHGGLMLLNGFQHGKGVVQDLVGQAKTNVATYNGCKTLVNFST